MLTYQSESVLRNIRFITGNTGQTFGFIRNHPYICLASDPSIIYDYSKYKGEINAIIMELADEGYIKPVKHNQYCLTELALHARQKFWRKTVHFLARNVLLPVAVSFTTTLITLYVNGILHLP